MTTSTAPQTGRLERIPFPHVAEGDLLESYRKASKFGWKVEEIHRPHDMFLDNLRDVMEQVVADSSKPMPVAGKVEKILRAQVFVDGHRRKAIAVRAKGKQLIVGVMRSQLGGEGLGEVNYSFYELNRFTIRDDYYPLPRGGDEKSPLDAFWFLETAASHFIAGLGEGYGD